MGCGAASSRPVQSFPSIKRHQRTRTAGPALALWSHHGWRAPASRASLWRRGGVEWRSAGQGERGRAGCLSQAARPLARTAMKSLCFNPRFFKRSFSSKSTEIRTYFRSMNKPSLPGAVVTTRITGSHYRIMLSLPEQCVITTACRSHYQMPQYSLRSAVIYHYQSNALSLQRAVLTTRCISSHCQSNALSLQLAVLTTRATHSHYTGRCYHYMYRS